MSLIDILTAVVLVLVSGLIIFLIVYLGKITKSIEQLQKDISDLSNRLDPLVTSLSDFSTKLTAVSEQARTQLDTTKEIIHSVKYQVNKFLDLTEKIRSGIDGPVSDILKQIRAISNGVSTFLNYLKK